ncbi:hypothetical protein DL96DRAFT_1213303 [Flagelloscypha sp. PMI_526]|nr:hypothetical protein DL96DRAFT_1213303 [Flagelloscypha sp. PMI_526]
MLISSTLHWSTFFLDLTIGIKVPLVELPGNDLKEQFNKVIQHNIPIMLFQYAVLPIHLLVCNTILVAQLWPLLRKSTPEKTIVSFLLCLSLVLAVLSAAHPPGFAVAGSEDTLKGWGIAFIATSFLSNIVNTVLIVVRRRFVVSRLFFLVPCNLSDCAFTRYRRFEYFSSGAILILLQFCLLVASTFTLTTLSTAEIFIRCFKQMSILITAAYPSFGIILGGLVVKDGGEEVEMGELPPTVGYVHLA